MKKLFLMCAFAFTMAATMSAQQQGNLYASAGLSVTNSQNVNQSSFTSVELGYTANSFSYGAVVGSTDLNFKDFWYEGKVAYAFNVANVNPYVLVGVGSYFDSTNNNMFIEYGAGVSVPLGGNVSPYLQVSNWDSANYLSVGLTYNFVK